MDNYTAKRFQETAEGIRGEITGLDNQAVAAEHDPKIEKEILTSQQERELDELEAAWKEIISKDVDLINRSNELFERIGWYSASKVIHDGENRPGKGEVEVVRAYADSRLVPLGQQTDDIELFAQLRMWGIFRGSDSDGRYINTPRVVLDGHRNEKFFEFFCFDGYEIVYIAGRPKKYKTGQDFIGEDVREGIIYGQYITKNSTGDSSSVDDILKVSTTHSITQSWAQENIERFKDKDLSSEERQELLDWLKRAIAYTNQSLSDYNRVFNEISESLR